ncbi:hypothetical protein SDC9_146409 [bioreactor metagenome]|uniref:Uncharacterized protein n=1 Tax=bioreactor metagenome TaxID=1076179 RepID=A0A645EDL4_9ZZZZ
MAYLDRRPACAAARSDAASHADVVIGQLTAGEDTVQEDIALAAPVPEVQGRAVSHIRHARRRISAGGDTLKCGPGIKWRPLRLISPLCRHYRRQSVYTFHDAPPYYIVSYI